MNSRCKKKITPICQHFKLPLEQILHVALIWSHSHIGCAHSSKLNSARKGSWIWHALICTTKLSGRSLARSWPGPTTTLPNSLQPGLGRGNSAETAPGRALPWGEEPLPAVRQAVLRPSAAAPGNHPRHLSLTTTDATVTSHVGDWEGSQLGWQIKSWVSVIKLHRPCILNWERQTLTYTSGWQCGAIEYTAFLQQNQTRFADAWSEANTDQNEPRWYKFAFKQMRPSSFTYLHLLFWGQLHVFLSTSLLCFKSKSRPFGDKEWVIGIYQRLKQGLKEQWIVTFLYFSCSSSVFTFLNNNALKTSVIKYMLLIIMKDNNTLQ